MLAPGTEYTVYLKMLRKLQNLSQTLNRIVISQNIVMPIMMIILIHINMKSFFLLVLLIITFMTTLVYTEEPKKIMYIPLRKGLREIKEIILTPKDVNSEEIKNLKDVVYLHLKEEM